MNILRTIKPFTGIYIDATDPNAGTVLVASPSAAVILMPIPDGTVGLYEAQSIRLLRPAKILVHSPEPTPP
jgi:hypothetical protein